MPMAMVFVTADPGMDTGKETGVKMPYRVAEEEEIPQTEVDVVDRVKIE